MQKRTKSFLIVLAVLLTTEAAVFFALQEPSFAKAASRRVNRFYYDRIRAYWGGRIAAAGGRDAYADLKRRFEKGDATVAHGVAHAFGEELFSREGLQSIDVCDDEVTFGCFHGFVGKAVASLGIDALDDIARACLDLFGAADTGCRHGMGHGVLEILGTENLDSALRYCEQVQRPGLLGCTHGAFMEYMTPERRAMDRAMPMEPCASTTERFRPSCYFQLTTWWDDAFDGDYGKMGLTCANLGNASEREACLLSIGRTAAELHRYDTDFVLSSCALMPSREAAVSCRAGAYWLYGDVGRSEGKERLCGLDDAAERARCVAAAATIYDAEAWR